MKIKAKIIRALFLTLVLQLGLAHVIQHDLNDFADAKHQHDVHFDFAAEAATDLHHHAAAHETHPRFGDNAHSNENCLLADIAQTKPLLDAIALPPSGIPEHDFPPIATRHVSLKFSKASPRAPPVSL
jgi:hypothetical protein